MYYRDICVSGRSGGELAERNRRGIKKMVLSISSRDLKDVQGRCAVHGQ